MRYSRILCGNNADPTILVENGKYYMTVSSFRYFPGLIVYESDDLANWKKINIALYGGVSDVWAPELCKIGNRYFIYFPTDGQNYAVWTDDLRGRWSQPVAIGASGLIDPGYIRDVKTGRSWLFFNGGYAAPLSDDGLSLAETPRIVYPIWQYPREWDCEGVCCESPKLFYRNGYYYLTLAEGGTAGPATSHMSVMLRSRAIENGWEFCPHNPVLHTYNGEERWWSVGHATPFQGTDGKWRFLFHAYEKRRYNEGRQILLCNAEWNENGWLRAADSDLPDNAPQERAFDFSENLPEKLFDELFFFGEFYPERISHENGALCLAAEGNSAADSRPLLWNETAGDFEISARFLPPFDADEFGLTFYYNENCSAGICLKGGYIHSFCLGGYHHEEQFTGKALRLKIVKRNDVLSYYYASDDGNFKKTEVSDEVSGFHHNVFKGFLSLRAGIYAAGKGRVRCGFLSVKPQPR